MNAMPWDGAGQARKALQGIVRDPQYGAPALSQPAVMSNLLKDLLPDEPREASLLVAAAQADLAGALRGYAAQGLDAGTAISLAANSFVTSTSHTPEACTWVVTELALAIGMDPSAARPAQATVASPQPGQPTLPAAVNAAFNQPGQPPYAPPGQVQPGQPPYAPPGQVQPGQPAWAAPASPWQPSPLAVQLRPPGDARPLRIVAGIIGLGGALLVLLGCIVPYIKYPNERAIGIFSGFPGAPGSDTFWFAAEPVGALAVAVVASIVVMARGGRGGIFGPGVLTGLGIQTSLLFGGYAFTVYSPATRHPGAILGLLGGIALLLAGLMSLAAARQSAGSGPTVTPLAGPAPGQVTPGVGAGPS